MDVDKSNLFILTDTEGAKFLGYRATIVNPCGDYYNPNDFQKGYVREDGDSLLSEDDIISCIPVQPFDCYYWDMNANKYELLTVRRPIPLDLYDQKGSLERMHTLLRLVDNIDTDETTRYFDDSLARANASWIRSWFLINAKCSGSIFIDSDNAINSDGEITIISDQVEIPQTIREGLDAGRQNVNIEALMSKDTI